MPKAEKPKPEDSDRHFVRASCTEDFKRRVEEHARREERTVASYIRHRIAIAMDEDDKRASS